MKIMHRYRLGFPVKVLGEPLRSHDSRRWQNSPHLSVSLAYVRDILTYLQRKEIRFYRLAGQLAPYLTHPGMPQFHRQIDECATELAATGDMAREFGIRLTLHPGHYVQLNSPDIDRAGRSAHEVAVQALLLDALGLDMNALIVVHVGGRYGDVNAGRERFVRRFNALPETVQQRLALENDDRIYSLADALWIHRRTGIRLVLDTLHHRCLNPDQRELVDALALALRTWPAEQTPKIHVSSPRTELRAIYRNGNLHRQMPLLNQHSDFINPFTVIDLLRAAQQRRLRPFDIMLEAKGKDLALLRLRDQIKRVSPELSAGVT